MRSKVTRGSRGEHVYQIARGKGKQQEEANKQGKQRVAGVTNSKGQGETA